MVYDDDIGPRGHIEIYSDEHPVDGDEQVPLPPPRVCAQIVNLAERYDWGPERIYNHLKRKRQEVPLPAIREVLTQAWLEAQN